MQDQFVVYPGLGLLVFVALRVRVLVFVRRLYDRSKLGVGGESLRTRRVDPYDGALAVLAGKVHPEPD